ncbi:MAG: NAD(P)-binding protein [Bacteriovoracaceae bacterium]|nr:NAD(P)-binding protein [Bacteriovoracaceae bacterium]
MKTRLGVIGAGAGGLAAALLAQSHQVDVTLFESHSQPGGCAGWFDRGPFNFDVGATTLSGIGEGRPFSEFQKLTGAPLQVKVVDPGIVFHLPHTKMRRYQDNLKWLAELERVFPGMSHQKFWNEIEDLSGRAWGFLPHVSGFPPAKWSDLKHLPSWLKGIALVPSLLTSLETFEKKYQTKNDLYKRWINALCMISAQNHIHQIPALIGSLALTYPAETFAPVGGMKGLYSSWLSHFESIGGQWRPRERVESLKFQNKNWNLKTVKSENEFEKVVANVTSWSLDKMIQESKIESPTEAWGAFTVYAAVKWENLQNETYHLVLPDESEGVDDYFVSFSLPNDTERAPIGCQTVTISQHTNEADWLVSKEIYLERKNQRMEKIWQHFFKTFGKPSEVKFLSAGTPHTFERYTLRPKGRVGGMPHRWSYPIWRWPSWDRGNNLAMIGDTAFPGQGMVAVVNCALNWWRASASHFDFQRNRRS